MNQDAPDPIQLQNGSRPLVMPLPGRWGEVLTELPPKDSAVCGTVVVRDVMIWANHIRGDDRLVDIIKGLEPGSSVTLEVASQVGRWVKTKQNDGQRTGEALNPDGAAKEAWRVLYQERRGDAVPIRLLVR